MMMTMIMPGKAWIYDTVYAWFKGKACDGGDS